jgi:hypothetical protein
MIERLALAAQISGKSEETVADQVILTITLDKPVLLISVHPQQASRFLRARGCLLLLAKQQRRKAVYPQAINA